MLSWLRPFSNSGNEGGVLARDEALADFGVDEFLTFVVSQDDFFFGAGDDVVGIEGDFSTTARSIENVLREGVASGVSAEAFDEVEPRLNGGSKV